MTNTIPRSNEGLATLAGDIANGLALHEATLEILQNTQAKVRLDLAGYDAAFDAYKAALKAETDQQKELRVVVAASIESLTLGRDVLKPFLGRSRSQAWDEIGLASSLAIDSSREKISRLLRSFKVHFAANPAHEVLTKDVTAARYQVLFDDLDAGRGALAARGSDRATARRTRDEKAAQLRKRVRDTIKELGMKLGPLDPRWTAFGLNMPGAMQMPDVPQQVVAVLIGNNAVAVKWAAAPRAEYYRVWKKVNGVDQELIAVGSPNDRDFTIEGLPANSTVEIAISAVNSGGETITSEVVTVVTH